MGVRIAPPPTARARRWIADLEIGHIQVVQADERLAVLWEGCKAAQVRGAAALGRLTHLLLPSRDLPPSHCGWLCAAAVWLSSREPLLGASRTSTPLKLRRSQAHANLGATPPPAG